MADQPIAFGVEPSKARYRLRLAKYVSISEYLQQFAKLFDSRPSVLADRYSLLDVGVGRGKNYAYAYSFGIEHRFEWKGVDIARFPAESRSGGANWSMEIADVQKGLPYPDENFDVVVAEQILEHLDDVDASIRELSRVTREDGGLIIGVPMYIRPIATLRNWYIRTFPRSFGKRGSGMCRPSASAPLSAALRSRARSRWRRSAAFASSPAGCFGLWRITTGGIAFPSGWAGFFLRCALRFRWC